MQAEPQPMRLLPLFIKTIGGDIKWSVTIPAPPALHTAVEIKAKSQTRYGRSSGEVEAEYLKLFEEAPSLIGPDLDDSVIGRRKI